MTALVTSIALRRNLALLRAHLPRACAVALAAGLIAAAASVAVAAAQPDTYRALATFRVLQRPGDSESLSRSKAIVAEQAVRYLARSGRAEEFAAEAVGPASGRAADYRGEWVVGPGFGQLSFEVTSADPRAATAAARAVYDRAGFLGMGLSRDEKTAPVLDLDGVAEATPAGISTTVIVAGGGMLGACAGFFLVLLAAVRPHPESHTP